MQKLQPTDVYISCGDTNIALEIMIFCIQRQSYCLWLYAKSIVSR